MAFPTCANATVKHSVKPRPRGRTWIESCSAAKARGKVAAISFSAAPSSQSGQSRISSSSSPPVDISSRMRDIFQARPTFITFAAGQ
jgi:hypothetical protein